MAGEDQCIFCHIASGKVPAKKVYEDDKVAAVLDINPATEGHVLLIPKAHVAVMPQMDDDLVAHVGMVAKQVSHALLRALKAEGTSVFVANGPVAGQRAPHFMLHLIPRRQGDDVGLQLPAVRMDEAALKAVFSKLSPAVAKQFGKEPPQEQKSAAEDQKSAAVQKPASASPQPADKKRSALDDIADFLTGEKK